MTPIAAHTIVTHVVYRFSVNLVSTNAYFRLRLSVRESKGILQEIGVGVLDLWRVSNGPGHGFDSQAQVWRARVGSEQYALTALGLGFKFYKKPGADRIGV